MTKSVEYSEFLDNLALRPVGKTKLTYIKELIDIESFKPLTQRNDKKTKMLQEMLQQEESFVKVAVDKNTSIIPTAELDTLKKEVKELQEAQKAALTDPQNPDNWKDKVKKGLSSAVDYLNPFSSKEK